MKSIWFVGLALPIACVTLISAAALAPRGNVRRVPAIVGAGTTASLAGLAWLLVRRVLGDAPPTLDAVYLQLAVAPLAIFAGAVVGMVTRWRQLRRE